MSMPASNQDESRSMKAIPDTGRDNSIRSRLPRRDSAIPPDMAPPPPASAPVSEPENGRRWLWSGSLLPAFWTVASIISILVNIVLLAILLSLWPLRTEVQKTADEQATGLLGGLYHNFVRMDQATIERTISVDANIPLDIEVPVKATTQILLSEQVVIQSPRVFIKTGGLTLDAPALVTLPAGTPLMVTLDFPLPVKDTIPVHLDVPVRIPLKETELHEPFVGLQKVVEPWYCMMEPNTEVNGLRVCSPSANMIPQGTATP